MRASSSTSTISKEHRYEFALHKHGSHFHYSLRRQDQSPGNSKLNFSNAYNYGHIHSAHCQHGEQQISKDNNDVKGSKDRNGGGQKELMAQENEGCPCCLASIDLDEIATALNEIAKNSGNIENHVHSGQVADFSDGAHWGIFLGISGPMALLGLTAAIRNIRGSFNTVTQLNTLIEGLTEDISRINKEIETAQDGNKQKLIDVVDRLEAFKATLKYSKFDAKFNLVVPGVINGAASTTVLSSAIVNSPWALPVIALYAGCQTTRNSYDLWRTWNKILPETVREEVSLNMKVGIRKINQITDSKRKFYATNTLGFAIFTAGAVITTASALSGWGAPGLAVGIPLLTVGAVSTGITNNIWTAKFRPRNGDLGIERQELDLDTIQKEIGDRRAIKKLLKNYRDKHVPSKPVKSFGCSLLSSLPFCNEKGKKLLHKVNQSRFPESNSNDTDRLDLLERLINAKKILKADTQEKNETLLKNFLGLEKISEAETELVNVDQEKPICEKIFSACKELKIDTMVLDRFIKNAIIKSSDEHDSSIKTEEEYFEKLQDSGLFKIDGNVVTFDLKVLEKNEDMKKAFMNSLEECLLFDYVEKLKYEQYGLNDFYWALNKQNKNQRSLSPVTSEPLGPEFACVPCGPPLSPVTSKSLVPPPAAHSVPRKRRSQSDPLDTNKTEALTALSIPDGDPFLLLPPYQTDSKTPSSKPKPYSAKCPSSMKEFCELLCGPS